MFFVSFVKGYLSQIYLFRLKNIGRIRTNNFKVTEKMKMLKLSLLLFFLSYAVGSYAANVLNYEIVGAGVGTQGSYLVKVWVVSKKSKPDINLIKKCAVHGVLFRGFVNDNKRGGQKPLAGSPAVEQNNKSYFEDFFKDEGFYRNYVTMVSDSYEIVKTKKKEYRIGTTLSVFSDQLRKQLVNDGIIRGLNTGF